MQGTVGIVYERIPTNRLPAPLPAGSDPLPPRPPQSGPRCKFAIYLTIAGRNLALGETRHVWVDPSGNATQLEAHMIDNHAYLLIAYDESSPSVV
ncbi:hypothetical protein H0H92_001383 [Tricholoma furcatifolium]|nr:hypothetical protein H0H92_001383 [Tricholoma furcatifolium]